MFGKEEAERAVDASWSSEMKKRAKEAWEDRQRRRPKIMEVPYSIRAIKPEAYQPKMISLGPFQFRQPLQKEWDDRMVGIKWSYLHKFLGRNPKVSIEEYMQVIRELEKDARSAYPEPLPEDMGGSRFAEMMLLDCCFLLEFLLSLPEDQRKEEAGEKKVIHEDDPITIMIEKWAQPLIHHDVLILQNQLPLCLLLRLFEKARAPCSPLKFEELVLKFFRCFCLFPRHIEASHIADHITGDHAPYHLLHLFHRCISPSTSMPMQTPMIRSAEDHDSSYLQPRVRCARELREAKVDLVKKKTQSVFLDISFQHAQVWDAASFWSARLEIPQLVIDDDTDTLFRNLIAFELCSPEVGDHVTAYAGFMDAIIDNNGDVALLRQEQILVNGLGSDKDVAHLFNRLCEEVPVDPHGGYLKNVMNGVITHCEKKRNRCWASLQHNYFNNPWAGVSVVAAIILFVLTLLQTIYTMRS